MYCVKSEEEPWAGYQTTKVCLQYVVHSYGTDIRQMMCILTVQVKFVSINVSASTSLRHSIISTWSSVGQSSFSATCSEYVCGSCVGQLTAQRPSRCHSHRWPGGTDLLTTLKILYAMALWIDNHFKQKRDCSTFKKEPGVKYTCASLLNVRFLLIAIIKTSKRSIGGNEGLHLLCLLSHNLDSHSLHFSSFPSIVNV